jgi:hypothetical protein
MKKQEKLLQALIGLESVLETHGIENIKVEIHLDDGTFESIDCYQEIKDFIIDFINVKPNIFDEANKEECEKALDNLYSVLENPCNGCNHNESELCISCNVKESLNIIRKIIKEHFNNTLRQLEYAINQNIYLLKQIEYFENPQPYKLEDLKPNMWVWDNKLKNCIQCDPGKNVMGVDCVWHWYDYDYMGELDEDYIEFEENRFFPVQKANDGLK